MTTTTGDPSTLKTSASLSGGDLVSRLLAATPPYLYNVPLTPHSFFFSEMLRSFVQAKTEAASASGGQLNTSRRRKRSWRDTRDRPLELTTKERPHHHHHNNHHHHHQLHHQHPDKYFHSATQSQSIQGETRLENENKQGDIYEMESKISAFDQKPNFSTDILKPTEENKTEFPKQQHGKNNFFEERSRHFEQSQQQENNIFPADTRKIKPEESQQLDRRNCSFDSGRSYVDDRSPKNLTTGQELSLLPDQKKLDFSRCFLPGLPGRGCEVLQGVKGFTLPGNMTSPEFLSGPLWYPPYPLAQSYPGIDPLHFFIDLRVSGHIWDRKHSERQLPFKSKHCSAFSVPQSKEYNSNRPLNLTRDEASTSKCSSDENIRGTNYILKHLTRTYRDIQRTKLPITDLSMENDENSKESHEANIEGTSKIEEVNGTIANSDEERKDLRALIGLELVVDYVKEPKCDRPSEQTLQVTE